MEQKLKEKIDEWANKEPRSLVELMPDYLVETIRRTPDLFAASRNQSVERFLRDIGFDEPAVREILRQRRREKKCYDTSM